MVLIQIIKKTSPTLCHTADGLRAVQSNYVNYPAVAGHGISPVGGGRCPWMFLVRFRMYFFFFWGGGEGEVSRVSEVYWVFLEVPSEFAFFL